MMSYWLQPSSASIAASPFRMLCVDKCPRPGPLVPVFEHGGDGISAGVGIAATTEHIRRALSRR